MGEVADNLARVREAVARAAEKAGRDPADVKLIAVSKTKPAALIEEALAAGQFDFGENYAQELRDKMRELGEAGARWHFIGKLQRNKVKYVAGKVEVLHTIDGLALAEEVDKRSAKAGAVTRALIEVNVGGEEQKAGVDPDEALPLMRAVMGMDHVEPIGLMTMPPYWDDAELTRPHFERLRNLRGEMRNELGDPAALPELSMGLSHDFEVAIEEGATMVRVGTAIFGSRR